MRPKPPRRSVALRSWILEHKWVVLAFAVLIVAAAGVRLLTYDRYLPYLDYSDETVPFLVARMPQGQEPCADEAEQFEPVWVRPADALQRHAAGQFFMIFPTIRTLERLRAYGTAAEVIGLREIDGRRIGAGRTGAITRRFQDVYHAVTTGGHPRSAQWLEPVVGAGLVGGSGSTAATCQDQQE